MDANTGVGILGCKLIHPVGSDHPTMFRFLTLGQLFWNIFLSDGRMKRSSKFGDPYYSGLSRDHEQEVDVVPGCFMLVRRDVIAEVGGLDERFFLYSEESEWCHRTRKAGWRIRYLPWAEVVHLGGVTTAHIGSWAAIELTRSQILYLAITRGHAAARAGAILMLVGALLRLSLPTHRRKLSRSTLIGRMIFLSRAILRLPRCRGSTRGAHRTNSVHPGEKGIQPSGWQVPRAPQALSPTSGNSGFAELPPG
jgi:GT2 family glycosyltransferase